MREYFKENVMMSVEIESGCGGRYWRSVKNSKLAAFLQRHEGEISDIDYCMTQPDPQCRRILNLADRNFRKNPEWCKKHQLTSFDAVIDFIIDHQLYR